MPHQLKELSEEIKLAKAALASTERRIAEYERFKTNTFFLTLERLRVERLEQEVVLARLKRERLLLQYYGPREMRLRQQQLQHEAAALSTVY